MSTLDEFMKVGNNWYFPIPLAQIRRNRVHAQKKALKKLGVTRSEMLQKANALIKKRSK